MSDVITVLAGSKITRARAGQAAKEFAPAGTGRTYEFVVTNGRGMSFESGDYILQPGDKLVVQEAGVAGNVVAQVTVR